MFFSLFNTIGMSEYWNFIPKIASPNILKGNVHRILRIFPVLVEVTVSRSKSTKHSRKKGNRSSKVQNIITHSKRGGEEGTTLCKNR